MLRIAPAWLSLFSCLLALGSMELLLRQAPHTGWPQTLADPGIIGDPHCDDHYWQAWAHAEGWRQPLRAHTAVWGGAVWGNPSSRSGAR